MHLVQSWYSFKLLSMHQESRTVSLGYECVTVKHELPQYGSSLTTGNRPVQVCVWDVPHVKHRSQRTVCVHTPRRLT